MRKSKSHLDETKYEFALRNKNSAGKMSRLIIASTTKYGGKRK